MSPASLIQKTIADMLEKGLKTDEDIYDFFKYLRISGCKVIPFDPNEKEIKILIPGDIVEMNVKYEIKVCDHE